jgi:hypothetical protein
LASALDILAFTSASGGVLPESQLSVGKVHEKKSVLMMCAIRVRVFGGFLLDFIYSYFYTNAISPHASYKHTR